MADKLYKDEAWLRHEYIDLGKSTTLIGKACGVSGHTIYWWMEKFGIPRRTTGFSSSESTRTVKDKLDSEEWLRYQYIDLEHSTVEIAHELGVNYGSVWNRLRRYKIPIRDTKQAATIAAIPKDIRAKLNDRNWLYDQYVIKEFSINKIKKIYKIDPASLKGALQFFGIPLRSRGEAQHIRRVSHQARSKLEDPSWMRNAYVVEKRDSYDIGCELCISNSTVTNWLRKHGIQIRSLAETHTGELHPLWNNGSSYEPYCIKFNRKFKESIRDKFNRRCFLCGRLEENKHHSVHHIDYNKNSICNGHDWAFVPLCAEHHSISNCLKFSYFNMLICYWAANPEINFNAPVIFHDNYKGKRKRRKPS